MKTTNLHSHLVVNTAQTWH